MSQKKGILKSYKGCQWMWGLEKKGGGAGLERELTARSLNVNEQRKSNPYATG